MLNGGIFGAHEILYVNSLKLNMNTIFNLDHEIPPMQVLSDETFIFNENIQIITGTYCAQIV